MSAPRPPSTSLDAERARWATCRAEAVAALERARRRWPSSGSVVHVNVLAVEALISLADRALREIDADTAIGGAS